MTLFTYKAKNKEGKIVEETIQAASREDVASLLKAEELQVLIVRRLEADGMGGVFTGKVSLAEKAAFCRFLGTMLRAGLSLPEAVEVIKQESTNKKLKKILSDLAFQTRKGKSISSVLSKYPTVFDTVFLTIVKAGEESGTLDHAFDYLSGQLSASYELTQKIKGSLMYPAVVISAMVGVGLLMILFVLPKISEVFLKMNLQLPTITRAILNFGRFTGQNVILVISLVFILIFLVFAFWMLRPTRKMIFRLLGKFPAIRRMMDQIDVARFARTLSTLLKSGVPITDALNVAAGSLNQPRLRQQAEKFSLGVSRGESLSEVLGKDQHIFPLVVIQTIKTGEKTGSLDRVLRELAEFYEQEVEHQLKTLTSLLEPILMLVIGIVVGAMVIMIVAPIYSIVGGLQSTIQR